ncbi:rRNA pseudouridine synthase [candidate division KSB1 bacterium]|nr:rRNA pseudouridine synthase [candidate division KSB1 bacterium]
MPQIRINKFLAMCGFGSRRSVEEMIQAGRVSIDGSVVTSLATKVDESRQTVCLDGHPITTLKKKQYVLLNKPKGYVTTRSDEKGRKTVYDLVKNRAVFPVGRLDRDSEGLLLLTNDGELAYRLTHPRFKVPKVYRVRLDRGFNQSDFAVLSGGMELEDGPTAPCRAVYFHDFADRLEIRLREGKKRQIRRMLEALGYNVKALKRVQFGPLVLKNVQRGAWRYLTHIEIKMLLRAVKLDRKTGGGK